MAQHPVPALPAEVPLLSVAVHLHPQDNVAIAKIDLRAGTILSLEADEHAHITVRQSIPVAHKVALQTIAVGAQVRRYGHIIGVATQAILPGDHVHLHNLAVGDFDRDYTFGADVRPVRYVSEGERRTFLGYRRPDGRVGTRNMIAVIASANCSAHVTREIAHHFTPERLAEYPNVDGVAAFAHSFGCSTRIGDENYVLLQRTLAGIARHPNVGACLLVGLGCEVNQIEAMVENCGLCSGAGILPGCPPSLVIQDIGGIRKSVQAGVATIEGLLPQVNALRRTPQPISELVLALQCGGSDGWSGVTANPIVGLVADEIVRQGGTVVLGETTEIYGVEHLLARRAVTPEVGRRLLGMVRWWEDYARTVGLVIDNNPTPGNKAGGLTTIYEKSLGAIAKAGSTPLVGVYDYAEPVADRGFTFMNTPGNDWASVPGQVAGGCNLVLFTTGRGSVFGFKPAPVIKIVSNSATYSRMIDDMDFNAGQVLDGVGVDQVAARLLELVIAVASGQRSKSEDQGVGEAEFVPWQVWGVL